MLTGSFDPITRGHMDIIERAARLCDRLLVTMLVNPDKEYFFTVEERLSFINDCVSDLRGVEAVYYDGYACDIAKEMNVDFFVRGMRGANDFEYEKQVAAVYKEMSGIDTLFLIAEKGMEEMSSTDIRNKLKEGKDIKDISDIVPEKILQRILL